MFKTAAIDLSVEGMAIPNCSARMIVWRDRFDRLANSDWLKAAAIRSSRSRLELNQSCPLGISPRVSHALHQGIILTYL